MQLSKGVTLFGDKPVCDGVTLFGDLQSYTCVTAGFGFSRIELLCFYCVICMS